MRYMGIDYGTKRVGVALTDESGTMAFPHAVYLNNTSLVATLESLIKENKVDAIVIGHSLNREGNPNQVQNAIEDLIQVLTLQIGLPIYLEPEQYSTQAAVRLQGKHALTDASAAALILDSFLMRRTNI